MTPQPPESRRKPLEFQFGQPETAAPPPAAPKAPPSKKKPLEFDFGASAPATPTGPPPEDSFLTRSIIKTALGVDAASGYDRVMKSVNEILPETFHGSWAQKFSERLARTAPEMIDFVTSPLGLGLVAAHVGAAAFPVAMPFVLGADYLLGGYQALRTIPSAIDAARSRDPEQVADAFKDIGYIFLAKRGTKAVAGETGFSTRPKTRPVEARQWIEQLRSADPEQKLAIASELSTPKGPKEKLQAGLYRNLFTRTLSGVLDVPKPKLTESAAYLIHDRDSIIGAAELSVAKFVHEFRKAVPVAERDVRKMGYVIEGSATADEVGLSPAARKWVGEIRKWNRDAEKMLNDAYGSDVKLHDPDTYLMHKWGFLDDGEVANKGGALTIGRRMLKDPQLRERVIGTYKEGIEDRGFSPAYNDIADLLTVRQRIAATAIANQRVSNTLTAMGLIVSEQDARKLGLLKAWPQLESKPLERSVYGGRRPSGEAIFKTRPVRVHPDIKAPLGAIFGEGFPLRDPVTGNRTMFGHVEALRAFGKQNAVGYSLFHNWAISEQSQAVHVGTHPNLKGVKGSIANTFLFNGDWYRGMKSGIWEVRKKGTPHDPPVLGLKHEVAMDWVQHGLRLGSAEAEGAVVRSMQEAHFQNPLLEHTAGKALRLSGNIHYFLNRGLWDFYLPGQMMLSAETIFGNEMRLRPRHAPEEIASLKYEISQHLNKVYGTESVASMMIHPKTRAVLNFALFAPVWTFSNFRVLTNGFQSEASHRLTGRWVAGAAATWFVASNLANYAATSWANHKNPGSAPDKDGKAEPGILGLSGHFMWDNPGLPVESGGRYTLGLTDNSINIFSGHNVDGSERYTRFGKGFQEPIKALMEPLQYLAGKTGLMPKSFMAWYTGYEPGTGFQVRDPNLPTGKQAAQTAMIASELVVPFVSQDLLRKTERYLWPDMVPEAGSSQSYLPGTPIPLGMPAKKGVNTIRAINAYEKARQEDRLDVAEAVLAVAEINHIPRGRIIRAYQDRLRKRKRVERGPVNRYDTYGSPAPPPDRE